MELNPQKEISKYNTARREIYAQTLDFIGKIALLLLSLSFIIYVFRIFDAHIPFHKLLSMCSLSTEEFLAISNYQGGWAWIKLLHKSDYLNYLPVALLSSASLISNIRLIPHLISEKDNKLAAICLIQIFIIFLSASGIIISKH